MYLHNLSTICGGFYAVICNNKKKKRLKEAPNSFFFSGGHQYENYTCKTRNERSEKQVSTFFSSFFAFLKEGRVYYVRLQESTARRGKKKRDGSCLFFFCYSFHESVNLRILYSHILHMTLSGSRPIVHAFKTCLKKDTMHESTLLL